MSVYARNALHCYKSISKCGEHCHFVQALNIYF